MKNTKINQVLRHLKTGKTLTKFQAFNRYQMTNLGDCILRLREHHNIFTVMCKNQKTKSRYAKYWMPEEVK